MLFEMGQAQTKWYHYIHHSLLHDYAIVYFVI